MERRRRTAIGQSTAEQEAGNQGQRETAGRTALEDWVERGHAPDRLIGYNFDWRGVQYVAPIWPRPADQIRFVRPVFPYPDRAIWSGAGDANDPDTWRRVTPAPDNG